MSKALALQSAKSPSLFPTESEWAMIKDQATMLVRSGLLPKGIDSPEKAIAVALKGRELGIPMMQAFAHIHIIQGKPTISAELMLALIYKNCPGAVIDYAENGADRCVIRATRPGSKPATWAFSIDEAKQAGLLNKDSWRNYPAAMLRARAIALMARAVFPDAIMGCSHTPEELGAEIDDEDNIIDVPADPAPAAAGLRKAEIVQPKTRQQLGSEIVALRNKLGWNDARLEEVIQDSFHVSRDKLTTPQMADLLEFLQAEAAKGVAV